MTTKFRRRAVKRTLEVDLTWLEPLTPAVLEVFECMEKDTIDVFRPDDEDAFAVVRDDAGGWDIRAKANLSVSIPDWFCVACQRIRRENEEDQGLNQRAIAWYKRNAAESLFGLSHQGVTSLMQPVGPAGCTGEIVFTDRVEQLLCSGAPSDRDRFRFIVAHELVHVFDAMRVIVPAFMDWDTYWEKALHDGCCTDRPVEILQRCSEGLDQYGSDIELGLIEEYWPSKSRQWFEAFRGGIK
ncbi:MAG: hypothetical protein GX575_06715 [Candidatus Anammoximicrobium sp.]|nr:hypothetical protein [Candidatus Anammoximicrobium sp.]